MAITIDVTPRRVVQQQSMFGKNKKKTVLDNCFTPKKTTICVFDEGDKKFRLYPLDMAGSFEMDKFLINIDNKIYILNYEVEHIKSYRSKSAPVVNVVNYFHSDNQSYLDLVDFGAKYPNISQIIKKLFFDDKREIVTLYDILKSYPGKDHMLQRTAISDQWYQMEVADGLAMSPVETSSQYISDQAYGNPQSIASVLTSVKNTDEEWRRISNPIQKGFDKLWIITAVIGVITAIGVGAYFLMEPGVSQEDLYNAIQRLDQANQTEPVLTPSQELWADGADLVPDQSLSVDQSSTEDSLFDQVNDIITESLQSLVVQVPDVRSSFEHTWQECRIVEGVQ